MTEHLIVYEQDPVFLRYAAQQLEVDFDPVTSRTVSHVLKNDDGTLTMLAVIVFTGWTKHSVEMSIASVPGKWATRRYFKAIYEYVFSHCEKERIHMVVEPSNVAAVEMHKRLGHKYEGQLDDWFGADRPVLIYGLTKRNYLKSKWSHKQGTEE